MNIIPKQIVGSIKVLSGTASYLLNYNRAKMIKLSPHFTLAEFVKSEKAQKYGISNIPLPQHREALQRLVDEILEPLREEYGKPITISSGYRCEELNKIISNSSSTSQHCKGEAADLVCNDLARIFEIIITNLPYDQLIWEHGWVHVSFSERHRRQVLRLLPDGGYQSIKNNWRNYVK